MGDPERYSARTTDVRADDTAHRIAGDHRRQLSRDLILDTAIQLVDQGGLHHLNMRRLGTACGVEAMALYRYVSGRDDLLNGIVDRMMETLHADHLRTRDAEDGWQDFMVRVADNVRKAAHAHPQLFPLIATNPPREPWVRPPLRSLRWLDTFLDTLIAHDFDDESAASAYRSFTTFLLGHLLLEVAGADVRSDNVNLDGYEHLKRLKATLSRDRSTDDFDDDLEQLLARIDSTGPTTEQ